MLIRKRSLGLYLCLLLAACIDKDPDGLEPLSVQDSSGTRIVTYETLGEPAAYRLGPPLLTIGNSPGEHEFGSIAGGRILPGGGVAIADAQTKEIVWLDSLGSIIEIAGGFGNAPGEFHAVTGIALLRPDTLIVHDASASRLTFFRGSDTWTEPVDVGVSLTMRLLGATAAGDLIMMPDHYWPFAEGWIELPLARYNLAAGSLDTITFMPYRLGRPETAANNVLAPIGDAALGARKIITVRGDRAQVEWWDSNGRLVTIVRWNEATPLFTDSVWAVYSAAVHEHYGPIVNGGPTEDLLARVRGGVTRTLPISGSVHADDVGRAWVGLYNADWRFLRRARVFSERGEWLGNVELPDRAEILDIADGLLLVVVSDQFDVESVALYRLLPPGSA